MKTSQQAYSTADKINKIINTQLTKSPVTAKNWHHWALLIRTVRTDLNLLEKIIENVGGRVY